MARTGRYEGDTWDLASSVGVTATFVAAARAIASKAEPPLIEDPFAEPLVRAVGVEMFTRLVSGDLHPEELGDDPALSMQRMTDNMAARTKFFDEFFIDATKAGIRQAVILASGLDARAYRLSWPAGTVVYEIDQPEVVEFKTRALTELGAAPTADRRAVGIDLRYDWPAALIEAGFDPGRPAAWSAEGLLGYLPPEAQDRLLDNVTALSAPGSWFAVETAPTTEPADEDTMRERLQRFAESWRDHGFDLDITELVYFGDRNEPTDYLADHGWQMSSSTVRELFAVHGLPPFDDEDMIGLAKLVYARGILNGKNGPRG